MERLSFDGFIDVHVHFRDPGNPAAETNETGLAAARAGGIAAVVTMPNTTPAGDSIEWLERSRRASKGTQILPSACITQGRQGARVAELERLAEAGAAFFTDDGTFVEDDRVMEEAMKRSAALGLVICQHAMTWKRSAPGVIRDCALARQAHLPIIPVSVETDAIRRDLAICRVTGCRLHIQHISTAEGVNLVREAQREGLPVTAEATPHHLLLSCDDLTVDDACYKMAPPLGNHEDRAELRRAVKEGVLMFATDHAPHPIETKNRGFLKSANGIIGLSTAIPITYRVMVEEEGMALEAWAAAWTTLPRAIISPYYTDTLAHLPQTVLTLGEMREAPHERGRSTNEPAIYRQLRYSCIPQPIEGD